MFYSKSTGGFYRRTIHGDTIPADAVEITAEHYAALLAGQSNGKKIEAGPDGMPVLADPTAPSLDALKTMHLKAIDDAADAARLTVAGDSLRAVEYQVAENEAKAYKDANYAGAVPPSVQSWAEAKGWTGQQAADDILAVAAAWNAALYSLRDIRLKAKEAVRSALTAGDAQAATDAAISQINAAVAGVTQ
jgi:hypothetical protein